jgi:hypothetical protein
VPRSRPVENGVVRQDLALEYPELRARLEPELLGHSVARRLVDRQRVRMTACTEKCEHQLSKAGAPGKDVRGSAAGARPREPRSHRRRAQLRRDPRALPDAAPPAAPPLPRQTARTRTSASGRPRQSASAVRSRSAAASASPPARSSRASRTSSSKCSMSASPPSTRRRYPGGRRSMRPGPSALRSLET